MATNADADVQQPSSTSKSKKQRKRKSKAAGASKVNGNATQPNGVIDHAEDENEDETQGNENVDEPQSPTQEDQKASQEPRESIPDRPASTARRKSSAAANGEPAKGTTQSDSANAGDTASRLDMAVKERNNLRDEVAELRRELEDIQNRHNEEHGALRRDADQARTGKDLAESKYNKLLGQVNNIKTQLGERLQADAAELETARGRISELEQVQNQRADEREDLEKDLSNLRSEVSEQSKQIETLRGRTNLSQQNWAKERDDLVGREASAREEFEAARQAMQDWEVLAMEERSLREGLSERVAGLEDALSTQRESYERLVSERESQSSTVEEMQRALQDVHDARKEERRELVESAQAQVDSLRGQLSTAEASLKEARETLSTIQGQVDRVSPLEKEVKEKTLQIGKLRHEAVILNDHLTKALRFLKRAKPDDNVDRQLVTNHLLQFLALERSDPKKFQVLQLISALLGWNDEQKEQAGLARPGAASGSGALKVPLSAPFRRVSSSAGLAPLSPSTSNSSISTALRSPPEHTGSPARGEGLAELWSDFLEREAEEGQGERSRRSSLKRSSGASTPVGRSHGAVMSPSESPQINMVKTRLDSVGEHADRSEGGKG
ncbi:MAG: hypothetical protein Q9159_005337 [Coniocarpon cinnabarinum]